MLTPCPVSIWPVQNSICFLSNSVSHVAVSNIVLLIVCFFPPFQSLPLHYFPLCSMCFCVCVCVCICLLVFFFFFCGWASVSPCWQKGITAPGIESSSQAFGWRSTSQMKRMLVHLKVVAELPVDVFAVTLSVISNPGWFGFLFRGFIQYLYIRV